MRMYDVITKKRFGGELSGDEIKWIIDSYVKEEIPDYQMSALLMAICFNGMTDDETAHLTQAMVESGDVYDLSSFGAHTVDKHSTGGVGDKTTLIVTPIVASLGCKVAKLSGRGLGHTGGTIDKLESIKGCRTDLSWQEFKSVVDKCGVCVCGAGATLVPADKKLYALRDVTATVSSVPLIASSIMSKKLAGGANTIVLDVKTGSGAFMKTVEEARELAKRMVAIGNKCGKRVSAVITNMDEPLGECIGNFNEVQEAASLLRNPSAYSQTPLYKVCLALATEIYGKSFNIPFEKAEIAVTNQLHSQEAYKTFLRWIELQCGDISLLDENSTYGNAKYISLVTAPQDGYITSINAEGIGLAAMKLGAGRATKTDIIDPLAGIKQLCRLGEFVKKGQPLAQLSSNTVSDHAPVAKSWLESVTISQSPIPPKQVIYDIIR